MPDRGAFMNTYLIMLIWLAAAHVIYNVLFYEQTRQRERVIGKIQVRTNRLFAILVFLPLIYYAGVRGTFEDTGVYRYGFNSLMPSSVLQLSAYMKTVKKDRAFYFMSALIKCFITRDAKVYFLILAALQGLILVHFFRKYSEEYVFSVFVFFASTDYISWMYNGIRQFTAVTITLLAADFIFRKKYIPAAIIIVIASLFHQSALIMLPIIFLVQGKAWSKRSLLSIFAAVLILAFTGRFTTILDNMLADTQYQNVVSDWQAFADNGTSIFRVLVYSVPTLLSFVGLPIIRREDDPVLNVSCNMAIMTTSLYLVSMVTSGIFIGRLPIYCSLYSMGILLPWEIRHVFSEESGTALRVTAVLAFLFFFYYQMHVAWGVF